MARSHPLLKKALLLIGGMTLLAFQAFAQPSFLGPQSGARAARIGNALGRFYDFFRNDYVLLFILYVGGWATVYLLYRIGLERSGRIPKEHCSKLASILSLITITPALYALQRWDTPKIAVRELMGGWLGISTTFMLGFIIFGLAYFHFRHWLGGVAGGGGGATP